jgi:hypothetical protein
LPQVKAKLPTLIDKADRLASQYIRQKFADFDGNITCVSCGKVMPWKESHCAHFIERGKKATRWLEENLMPACPGCNTFRKEFHSREYTLAMIDLHGREFIDELRTMANEVLSGSKVRQLAEEAIEYYSQQLKEAQ